jgi:hypothetical protein
MNEISNHWLVHQLQNDRPISIRAIKPKGSQLPLFAQNRTFHPSRFISAQALKDAFEAEAQSLSAAGYNIYTVMNQIRSDFFGSLAVKDADITHRTTLLVDIDRIGDTSHPATDAEIDAAFELAGKVESYLRGEGFPDPFWVHSGNGCHLYYRTPAIPQSALVTQTVELFLKGLANRFNNSVVSVDTSVFNASRITKVIGTYARKGVESEGRPYRIARLV